MSIKSSQFKANSSKFEASPLSRALRMAADGWDLIIKEPTLLISAVIMPSQHPKEGRWVVELVWTRDFEPQMSEIQAKKDSPSYTPV